MYDLPVCRGLGRGLTLYYPTAMFGRSSKKGRRRNPRSLARSLPLSFSLAPYLRTSVSYACVVSQVHRARASFRRQLLLL